MFIKILSVVLAGTLAAQAESSIQASQPSLNIWETQIVRSGEAFESTIEFPDTLGTLHFPMAEPYSRILQGVKSITINRGHRNLYFSANCDLSALETLIVDGAQGSIMADYLATQPGLMPQLTVLAVTGGASLNHLLGFNDVPIMLIEPESSIQKLFVQSGAVLVDNVDDLRVGEDFCNCRNAIATSSQSATAKQAALEELVSEYRDFVLTEKNLTTSNESSSVLARLNRDYTCAITADNHFIFERKVQVMPEEN